VSDDPERDTLCVEADGLALEIDVAPGAASLDDKLPAVIAAAVSAANEVAGPAQGAVTVVVDGDEAHPPAQQALARSRQADQRAVVPLPRHAAGSTEHHRRYRDFL
jgi:hypothetical protein